MSNRLDEPRVYEEAAFDGARLIDEYFRGIDVNPLFWSPDSYDLPNNTALVYGDDCGLDESEEAFKQLLRTYFERTGFRELSYVEYYEGCGDPFWVMLVQFNHSVDLEAGVHLCWMASRSWSLKQILRRPRYPKRRLDRVMKLLIPGWQVCDLNSPLDQLILTTSMESSTAAPVAAERHDAIGGSVDE